MDPIIINGYTIHESKQPVGQGISYVLCAGSTPIAYSVYLPALAALANSLTTYTPENQVAILSALGR